MQEPLDNLSFSSAPKKDLVGAGNVLVLGIVSIPFCFGLIGLIMALNALSRSKLILENYNQHPELYTESSYKKVKAGRTCAFVSLSILTVGVLLMLILTSR